VRHLNADPQTSKVKIFGDLISCQNDRERSTAIAGKVEMARVSIPRRG
jgi:hypothetical protein